MSEYLILFRNVSGEGAYVSTAEDMARDMPAWQGWIGQIAQQGKLVSTQPIKYEGTVVDNAGTRPGPDKGGNNVLVAGYMLCKADSEAEVQAWAASCPILRYPQGSVEVRPMIPFPLN